MDELCAGSISVNQNNETSEGCSKDSDKSMQIKDLNGACHRVRSPYMLATVINNYRKELLTCFPNMVTRRAGMIKE